MHEPTETTNQTEPRDPAVILGELIEDSAVAHGAPGIGTIASYNIARDLLASDAVRLTPQDGEMVPLSLLHAAGYDVCDSCTGRGGSGGGACGDCSGHRIKSLEDEAPRLTPADQPGDALKAITEWSRAEQRDIEATRGDDYHSADWRAGAIDSHVQLRNAIIDGKFGQDQAAEVKRLNAELDDARKSLLAFVDPKTGAVAELSALRADLRLKNDIIVEATRQLTAKDESLDDAAAELSRLRAKVERLTRRHTEATYFIDTLRGERIGLWKQRDGVLALVDEILVYFTDSRHPGEPCKRTSWVRESRLAAWHERRRAIAQARDQTGTSEQPQEPLDRGLNELARDLQDSEGEVPAWLAEILHVVKGFADREHQGAAPTLVPWHAQNALFAVPADIAEAARINPARQEPGHAGRAHCKTCDMPLCAVGAEDPCAACCACLGHCIGESALATEEER